MVGYDQAIMLVRMTRAINDAGGQANKIECQPLILYSIIFEMIEACLTT